MKKYTASEELAQILKKNGFKEITSTKFPKHQDEIEANGYTSGKSKRAFSINSKDSVEFDYLEIKPRHKGRCDGPEMKTELSENELKSIIAFFNMPFQSRNAYKRNGGYIPNFYTDYLYMKENPDFKKENRQIVIDAFENIIL